MGTDDLLKAIFDCWEGKKQPYLNGIIEEFANTANVPCADGDATIWDTKLTEPPTGELTRVAKSSGGLDFNHELSSHYTEML